MFLNIWNDLLKLVYMFSWIFSTFIKNVRPNLVFSSLPDTYCWYYAVILVRNLIMCGGGKICQSFKGHLQTFEA